MQTPSTKALPKPMTTTNPTSDTFNLTTDIQWMLECLSKQLEAYGEGKVHIRPTLSNDAPVRRFLNKLLGKTPTEADCLVFLLALCPHYQSHLLDQHISQHVGPNGDFPQVGGIRGKNFRGFLPTGETVMLLVAGPDTKQRALVHQLFSPSHPFLQKRVLWLGEAPVGEPINSAALILNREIVEQVLYGSLSLPRFSMHFPAQQLNTNLEWKDLILRSNTAKGVQEILHWLQYGHQLKKDAILSKRIKPGYRALFHGPSGTGKTLTAALLGKKTGQPVFRVDLSMVISKFIGETEKNLANLFTKAENKNWILFFDEADALFGKRTGIRDAHDKYANQEVAYLLQRIEDFDGLVILASNLKDNIDNAFLRRFQTIVHFPAPGAIEREELWRRSLGNTLAVEKKVDWKVIARQYELTGANIISVIHYAHLVTLAKGSKSIALETIIEGVRREFQKIGKIL